MAMAYEDELRRRRSDPRRKQYARDYYQRNKEHFRRYNNEYRKKWRQRNNCRGNYKVTDGESNLKAVATNMLSNARARSRRQKWPFLLTHYWVLSRLRDGKCELTGLPFVLDRGHPFRPSLDRVDSNGHYTPENCRLILLMLNTAKLDAPDGLFQDCLRQVAEAVVRSPSESFAPSKDHVVAPVTEPRP